jgi:hypothetical protein
MKIKLKQDFGSIASGEIVDAAYNLPSDYMYFFDHQGVGYLAYPHHYEVVGSDTITTTKETSTFQLTLKELLGQEVARIEFK